MQLTITGRHIDVSEAFRSQVEQALQDFNRNHQLSPIKTDVVVSKPAHLFRSEIESHIGRGITIRSHSESTDAYLSLTQAMTTLSQRLRKYKRRLVDHHKLHDIHLKGETASYMILNGTTEEDHEDLAPAIIAEMPKDVLSLSVGDAVMKMDLSSENMVFFRNNSSMRLNIVYRRADGNIGWVDLPSSN